MKKDIKPGSMNRESVLMTTTNLEEIGWQEDTSPLTRNQYLNAGIRRELRTLWMVELTRQVPDSSNIEIIYFVKSLSEKTSGPFHMDLDEIRKTRELQALKIGISKLRWCSSWKCNL